MTVSRPLAWLESARSGGYAVGAFNMHNDETTQALLEAAEQADSPVFLQVGRAVIPHMGLRAAYEMTVRNARGSGADHVIHLDHGTWPEVLEAVRLGFDSIMYDGAHLPFEENIRTTRRVVELAHDYGIPVEAELGKIPDAGAAVAWDSYYTDPDEAERFVAETGVDFLAISAGVVHGVVPDVPEQPLAIDLIERIRSVVPVPLVLHGASGVPDEEIRAAIAAGVHKFNADTDLRHEFRRGVEEAWAEGDRQLEYVLARGKELMIAATVAKLKLYGCAGHAADGAAAGAVNGAPAAHAAAELAVSA